jgi:Uma2 family endonuclease
MAQVQAVERREPPSGKLTYEEFLDWYDGSFQAEWVDGAVIVLMPPTPRHALIAMFLAVVLELYVRMHNLGHILAAPVQVKLPQSGREPDILFIASEHLDRILATRIQGPVDLAIEVVSPESVRRDRVEKLAEYEAASVREYWLIDPDTQRAEFYRLGADGRFAPVALDAAGRFHSEVLPGFWLHVAWLWRDPLPELDAVIELGLIDELQRSRQKPAGA